MKAAFINWCVRKDLNYIAENASDVVNREPTVQILRYIEAYVIFSLYRVIINELYTLKK
jgi:hypothetical protein